MVSPSCSLSTLGTVLPHCSSSREVQPQSCSTTIKRAKGTTPRPLPMPSSTQQTGNISLGWKQKRIFKSQQKSLPWCEFSWVIHSHQPIPSLLVRSNQILWEQKKKKFQYFTSNLLNVLSFWSQSNLAGLGTLSWLPARIAWLPNSCLRNAGMNQASSFIIALGCVTSCAPCFSLQLLSLYKHCAPGRAAPCPFPSDPGSKTHWKAPVELVAWGL